MLMPCGVAHAAARRRYQTRSYAPRRPPVLSVRAARSASCCSPYPSSPTSSNGLVRATSQPYNERQIGDDRDDHETDQGSCTSSGKGSGSPRLLKLQLLLLLSRLQTLQTLLLRLLPCLRALLPGWHLDLPSSV